MISANTEVAGAFAPAAAAAATRHGVAKGVIPASAVQGARGAKANGVANICGIATLAFGVADRLALLVLPAVASPLLHALALDLPALGVVGVNLSAFLAEKGAVAICVLDTAVFAGPAHAALLGDYPLGHVLVGRRRGRVDLCLKQLHVYLSNFLLFGKLYICLGPRALTITGWTSGQEGGPAGPQKLEKHMDRTCAHEEH
mmetsp:Transcript_16152/g.38372  ORF Transcript_16152/g.38372 Transcript_16152/m.38372 type:complete len:201 (+) Transcript_16152:586-1188(+)